MDILKLNTLKSTKTAFLTPKRYDKHPHQFYMGAPGGGGGGGGGGGIIVGKKNIYQILGIYTVLDYLHYFVFCRLFYLLVILCIS